MPDSSDEEIEMSDAGGDESAEGEGEDGGFFSGEDDLQEVKLEKDDEDESEGEDLQSQADSYGSEGGSEEMAEDEDEEGMDIPQEETKGNASKKSKKRNREEFEGKDIKKTKSGSRYASYEDFAHLLEEDIDDAETDKPKKMKHFKPNYGAYS